MQKAIFSQLSQLRFHNGSTIIRKDHHTMVGLTTMSSYSLHKLNLRILPTRMTRSSETTKISISSNRVTSKRKKQKSSISMATYKINSNRSRVQAAATLTLTSQMHNLSDKILKTSRLSSFCRFLAYLTSLLHLRRRASALFLR